MSRSMLLQRDVIVVKTRFGPLGERQKAATKRPQYFPKNKITTLFQEQQERPNTCNIKRNKNKPSRHC